MSCRASLVPQQVEMAPKGRWCPARAGPGDAPGPLSGYQPEWLARVTEPARDAHRVITGVGPNSIRWED